MTPTLNEDAMTPSDDERWTARQSREEMEDQVARDRAERRDQQVADWERKARGRADRRADAGAHVDSAGATDRVRHAEREGRADTRGDGNAADRRGGRELNAPLATRNPRTRLRDLGGSGWKLVAKRTLHSFTEDKCTDLAAGLTYYAVLSIFPALIALVSLLGVFGQGEQTTQAFLDIAKDLGADPDSQGFTFVEDFIKKQQESGGAGLGLVVGILGALWSASNYVNAFSRTMNTIYEVKEGRPFYVLRPVMVLVTAIVLIAVVAIGLSFVLTGPVAEAVLGKVGLGGTAITVWNWAKWPVAALVVILIIRLLYWATPNVKLPRRILTPGAVLAFVVWVLATAAFGLYIAFAGNYSATYGAMAGVIIFLLWLWLTNTVILLGAELDAAVARVRNLGDGAPVEDEFDLPVRSEKNIAKAEEKYDGLIADSREYRMTHRV
ncbi:YihY/virulence factor BrkB family protein [Kytococcus sp. Marseille-QA3725]